MALVTTDLARPASASVRPRDAPTLSVPSLVMAVTTAAVVWVGAVTLAGRGQLGGALGRGWEELAGPVLLVVLGAVVVCEQMWPAEKRRVLATGHVQDACFAIVYVACVVPIMTLLGVAFAAMVGGGAGWMVAPWTASWPLWLIVPVTLVAMDGANWVAHSADHRLTALWRFHAVHHSQEELSVLTSFRAHPLVHTTGFFLATVAVVFLMGDRSVAPLLITLYVCGGTVPHANVRWTFGPVGKVIVSPAYHRVHHAVDGPDGANLGIVLTVWDVLAGRALFPTAGGPVPGTGLAGRPWVVEQGATGSRLRVLAAQLGQPFVPAKLPRSGPRPPLARSGVGGRLAACGQDVGWWSWWRSVPSPSD